MCTKFSLSSTQPRQLVQMEYWLLFSKDVWIHSAIHLLIYLTYPMKWVKFPTGWKQANVVPIYKKGDKVLINNYRPVSLLSIISKCLEHCIFNKIYPIIDQQLHKNQHGFRKGQSTTTSFTTLLQHS